MPLTQFYLIIYFRCLAQTLYSREKFNIDLSPFTQIEEDEESDSDSDDEEDIIKKKQRV